MRSMQPSSTGRAAVRGVRSPAATAEADRRHGWEMLRSIWQFRHVCLWVYGGGCGRADTRRPLFTGGDRRRSLRVGGPSSRELSGPIGRGRILSPESRVCELSLVHAGAYVGDGCRIIIIIVPAKTIGKGAHTRGSVTDGQDVELPMSFEVRAGDERQCRGDGVESFTGSTWEMASGTPVLLRPGVYLVMGSAIASDHTGKIGVCCFGLASQAGS